jgi:hypothetical protein
MSPESLDQVLQDLETCTNFTKIDSSFSPIIGSYPATVWEGGVLRPRVWVTLHTMQATATGSSHAALNFSARFTPENPRRGK